MNTPENIEVNCPFCKYSIMTSKDGIAVIKCPICNKEFIKLENGQVSDGHCNA